MASGLFHVPNRCPEPTLKRCKRLLESQFVSESASVIIERQILTVIVSPIVVQIDFPDCRKYPSEGVQPHGKASRTHRKQLR